MEYSEVCSLVCYIRLFASKPGPWVWAAHGLGTLGAGAIGYWAGSEVANQIYEVAIQW